KDEPRPHGGYEKTDNARGSVDALRPDLLQNYFGIDQGQVGNSHRRYDRQTDRGEGLQFFAGLFHSGYHADDRGNSPRAEHDRHGQGDESDIFILRIRTASGTMNRFPLRWRREHLKTDTSEYDSADYPDHAQGNAEEPEHKCSKQEK